MKKLNLLIATLVILSIFACSSNDDSDNPDVTIVGTWKPVSGHSSETGDYELSECGLMSRMTFNQNGTGNLNEFNDFDGDGNCNEVNSSFAYTINSNILIIDESLELNFELTSTTLSITYPPVGSAVDTVNWQRVE